MKKHLAYHFMMFGDKKENYMVYGGHNLMNKMTYEEAIRILHPDTTASAIAKYEYYGGFHGKEAGIKAVEDACIVACEAMQRLLDLETENK